jgi:hypothetical protein
MKEPTRWRDLNGGADAETRALLQNDRVPMPSDDEVNRIWSGLETQLNIAPGPIQVPQVVQTAAVAGTGALVGKVTLAVVLVATVGTVVGVRGFSSRQRQEDVARQEKPGVTSSENQSPANLETIPPLAVVPPTQPIAVKAVPLPLARESRSHVEKITHPKSIAHVSQPTSPRPSSFVSHEMPEPQAVKFPSSPSPPPPPPPPPTPSPSPSPLPPRPLSQTPIPSPISAPPPTLSPPPIPSPPPPSHVQSSTRSSTPSESTPVSVNELLEESRRLDRVRTALRAHNPDRALQLLADGAPRTNALAQEREALTIEVMASKPSLRTAATERARAFMRAYPQSPYRARIRALVFDSK